MSRTTPKLDAGWPSGRAAQRAEWIRQNRAEWRAERAARKASRPRVRLRPLDLPARRTGVSMKWQLWMLDPYCCWCAKYLPWGRSVTVEHLMPLSRGGKNEWGNVRIACKACNTARGNPDDPELGPPVRV